LIARMSVRESRRTKPRGEAGQAKRNRSRRQIARGREKMTAARSGGAEERNSKWMISDCVDSQPLLAVASRSRFSQSLRVSVTSSTSFACKLLPPPPRGGRQWEPGPRGLPSAKSAATAAGPRSFHPRRMKIAV
jgi:hypothetical protein